MKRIILSAAILMASGVAWSSTAFSSEVGTTRKFGLGFQLADPTALIGKVFMDRNDAIDFGFGFWSYGTCYGADGRPYYCDRSWTAYSIHVDYLYEDNIVDRVVRLDWHVGGGGRIIFWGSHPGTSHDWALLGRVPIGLDLAFRRVTWLETYLELAPGIQFAPALDFIIDIGLGARAYF